MSVTVFFGSGSISEGDMCYSEAMALSKVVASRGIDIATGGYGGVMEAALRGALDYHVKRIGVTCDIFKKRLPNNFLTDEIKTKNYFERLEILIDIGDLFIAVNGESGTLVEVSAIVALLERDIIQDRILLLLGPKWYEIDKIFEFTATNSNIYVAADVQQATDFINQLEI